MTPFEELQAAHKRLSELRADGPAWTARLGDAEVLAGQYFVAHTATDQYTDLIVTLHRTIEAQLLILDHGINDDPGWYGPSYEDALRLARAVNGVAGV